MSDSEKTDKGFKVTDRRKFTPDGRPRPEAETEEPPAAAPEETPPRREPSAPSSARRGGGAGPLPTAVSFLDLVSMLANNALVQLGEIQDPVSGSRVENLQGAQLMIDLLAMLQQKTKGNLSEQEDRALDDILYDLRMRFVAKSRTT